MFGKMSINEDKLSKLIISQQVAHALIEQRDTEPPLFIFEAGPLTQTFWEQIDLLENN